MQPCTSGPEEGRAGGFGGSLCVKAKIALVLLRPSAPPRPVCLGGYPLQENVEKKGVQNGPLRRELEVGSLLCATQISTARNLGGSS